MSQIRVASKVISGLYAVIDTTYVDLKDIEKAASEIISGGAKVLQLRAKGAGAGEVLKAAKLLRGLTSRNNVTFIVNDRVDVALLSASDGVHLGQDDIPVKEARSLLGETAIIGLSTHNVEEAKEANGADYISFGPIFSTKTKKDALGQRGLGALSEVTELSKRSGLPVVAIGGITEENVPDVFKNGADAAAIISDILNAGDIRKKVSGLISIIEARKKSPFNP